MSKVEEDISLQYIAGFFDGDGCINASKSGLRATITNTNLDILKRIQQKVNGGTIRKRLLKDGETRKDCYYLCFWCYGAIEFIKAIYPYLIIKKSQAEIAFILQSTYRKVGAGKGSYGNRRLSEEILKQREELINQLKIEKHVA